MLRRLLLPWFSTLALLMLVDCNASSSEAQSFLDAFQAAAEVMEVRHQKAEARQFRPTIWTGELSCVPLNMVS